MPTTEGTAQPTIDWRDWIAFLGYVLAAAVVVSVMLASVVLVISMQAEGPKVESAASPETRQAAPQAHRAAPETREAPPARPAAAAKASAAPVKTPPNSARIEVTAESLRADKPIATPPPAPSLPGPASRPAGPASESAAAQAAPADAAGALQRLEITSESLRAEQPIGPAPAEPVVQAPASSQPAQALAPAVPTTDASPPAAPALPATVEQVSAQPDATIGSAR